MLYLTVNAPTLTSAETVPINTPATDNNTTGRLLLVGTAKTKPSNNPTTKPRINRDCASLG